MTRRLLQFALLLASVACHGQGFISQWQNQGTPIATNPSWLPVNCSTNLTCTLTNGVVVITASGGSASAGGNANTVQFNSAGALGGIVQWTSNGTTTVTASATGVLDMHAGTSVSNILLPGAFATGFLQVTTTTGAVASVGSTGSGNVVLATSPSLTTPALGTPSAIVLTNATGAPTWNQNTTGTAANLTGSPALPSGTSLPSPGAIGGTTPAAITGTTITANTSLTINGGTAQTGTQGTDTKLLTAGTVSGTAATLCTDASGGATTTGCSSGGSTALSALTAATGSNTIANGNNGLQIWNWAPTTNQNQFQFGETSAATAGTLGSQDILSAKTLAGSTAVPFAVIDSLTGSQTLPALYVTPTWNTTGVVDAGILENVTNTASGAASLLMDLQVGGTSQFKVDKAGNATALTSFATGGSNGGLSSVEGTGASLTAATSTDLLYPDSTNHCWHENLNNVDVGCTVTASNTVTMTNKTLTSPTLTTPALGAATATSLLATGIVDGQAPITITSGTTANLGTTYKSGYTFNQEATAGTGVTYTLPATATGLQYCVSNSIVSGTGAPDTGVLTVYPPASSYVILNGVINTIGGGGTHGVASGGAAADSACFVAIDATHWNVYVQKGTWTAN